MTWKPMLFSGPMIRAIREGRKRQTRRVVKFPHDGSWSAAKPPEYPHEGFTFVDLADPIGSYPTFIKCPHPPGTGIWVKENYYYDLLDGPPGDMDSLYYIADANSNEWCCELIPECQCAEVGKPKIRSGRFMPKWAARTFLEVESVKVERLQEISEEDAKAEGVTNKGYASDDPLEEVICRTCGSHRDAHVGSIRACRRRDGEIFTASSWKGGFRALWDSINGKKHPWSSSPWVWAYTFRSLTLAEATEKGWRAG